MKKLVVSIIFLFLLNAYPLTLTPNCYAQPISSRELINNTKGYDGKTIVYAGEVIGDIMQRGNHAWINVYDGENTIGIWVDSSLIKEINYTGSYKSKGDEIEIIGVFRRACPEHGGDLDIHAETLRKIRSGVILNKRLNLNKKNLSLVLLGILCLILILRRLKTR